ncbi:dual specificity protein phosphatase 3-like protein [Euroglyphus maynei]|uniref:protein-serine/threonine phosphatase n=1 Tax=Euroglyphus maynei TaxID=6958 RepID=A0A1Y3BFB1_EURMA|nr:dual specificity protein phosphatase 3-like protein [Euroglyphus maynei]
MKSILFRKTLEHISLYAKIFPLPRTFTTTYYNRQKINIGDSVQVERSFTQEDVAVFARLTHDNNPIHFDESLAIEKNFAKPIVHGALINGVISSLIGTKLPGYGSILIEQDLHFPNPCDICWREIHHQSDDCRSQTYAARSKPFLKDIGVTHVLNCALTHCLTYNDMKFDQEYYQDFRIKFKGLELDDICTENIARYFDEAIEFIDDAMASGGKVLVHCLAGISRSATITIAYLMERHSMTIEDAIKTVKQNRRIYPNEGFLKQLVELDFKLRKRSINR